MQTKRKKWLLITGWLAVFLFSVAIFSDGQIVQATAPQCSDGLDNDGYGDIDIADPNCHTDANRYNFGSYDPNINVEYGEACFWTCYYDPKLGRIIVEFDHTNKIKSNGTIEESRTPATSTNIQAGYYNISMFSVDGYASRPSDAPQPREIWRMLLMGNSGSIIETTSTRDMADKYTCIGQTHDDLETNFFVAEDVNSVVAQHAAYPDESSSNDLFPVCAAFDLINQSPDITLLGSSLIAIDLNATFTDPGATSTDPEDGNLTSSVTATGTVNTSATGTYPILYSVTDSGGLTATTSRTVIVVYTPVIPQCSNCGGGGGGGAVIPQAIPLLSIFNEKVEVMPNNSVLITWQTNASADSRVTYGTSSVNNLIATSSNYGYTTTTLTANDFILSHSLLITNLQPDKNYYFRPISDNPSVNPATGKELTLTTSEQMPLIVVPAVVVPAVIVPPVVECNYLLEYLRMDLPNNPVEVIKLQRFLKENEGFADLQVNSIFDQATLDAVNIFQMRYSTDVLIPWGYDYNQPTGYVYITTKKKINELYCQRPFPLTSGQEDEITDMRDYLQTIPQEVPLQPATTTAPIIGQSEIPEIPEEQGGLANCFAGSAITSLDNEGRVVSQATTSKSLPSSEASNAMSASIADISNINNTNTDSQEAMSNKIESLFLVGFVGKLANTSNALLLYVALVVLLIVLAFVFIIKRKRKQSEYLYSNIPDGLPVSLDKL